MADTGYMCMWDKDMNALVGKCWKLDVRQWKMLVPEIQRQNNWVECLRDYMLMLPNSLFNKLKQVCVQSGYCTLIFTCILLLWTEALCHRFLLLCCSFCSVQTYFFGVSSLCLFMPLFYRCMSVSVAVLFWTFLWLHEIVDTGECLLTIRRQEERCFPCLWSILLSLAEAAGVHETGSTLLPFISMKGCRRCGLISMASGGLIALSRSEKSRACFTSTLCVCRGPLRPDLQTWRQPVYFVPVLTKLGKSSSFAAFKPSISPLPPAPHPFLKCL